jgi:hypothetical protein
MSLVYVYFTDTVEFPPRPETAVTHAFPPFNNLAGDKSVVLSTTLPTLTAVCVLKFPCCGALMMDVRSLDQSDGLSQIKCACLTQRSLFILYSTLESSSTLFASFLTF